MAIFASLFAEFMILFAKIVTVIAEYPFLFANYILLIAISRLEVDWSIPLFKSHISPFNPYKKSRH